MSKKIKTWSVTDFVVWALNTSYLSSGRTYSRPDVRGNAFGIPPNGAVASRFGGGLRHFPEQWLNAIETAPSHCSVGVHVDKIEI
jgi:hypothetical protein